jgi:hypothetical protein
MSHWKTEYLSKIKGLKLQSIPCILYYRGIVPHPISISIKSTLVEYPYVILKRIFHFPHAMETTSKRIKVKTSFTVMCCNLVREIFLNRIA